MHMIATLKLTYAGVPAFLAMAPRLRQLAEAGGWKLEKALLSQTGRFNTVTHLWKLRDMNHFHEVVTSLQAHPDFPEIYGVLCQAVDEETIVFAEETPYSP